ncbi:EAL domain-containing protein [Pseudoalteromonas sp.]|uniref:EAL domain-containing protein n=1 Tax=Pseudoalteromonas sp. TaxID=53249 RepID=UPI00356A56B4
MDLKDHTVFIFDISEEQRSTTQKCIEYLWAGRIFTTGELASLQSEIVHGGSADTLVISANSFGDVDMTSWLLGTGFKGRLVLLLGEGDSVPLFLPCELIAQINKPVKLSDFNQVFSQRAVTEHIIDKANLTTILSRRDCVTLDFQPEFRSHNEKLSGFECLVRFQENGIKLSTKQVMDAIEKHQLIDVFSDVFFQRIAEVLPAFSSVRLSINLSLIDLGQYDLLKVMSTHLNIAGINPNQIIFEFPIDAFYSSNSQIIGLLAGLKELGFCLAIDGGDGILTRLEKLPLVIDEIKIPVDQLQKLEKKQTDKMAQFYHHNSVDFVFVKIESYQQQKLVQNNFTRSHMQGYYLAPPIPVNQVFEMLKNNCVN